MSWWAVDAQGLPTHRHQIVFTPAAMIALRRSADGIGLGWLAATTSCPWTAARRARFSPRVGTAVTTLTLTPAHTEG